MKLAKLLGAGKSFFGGQGLVAYRENKRVYLPKFNCANPFAPKPKDSAEVSEPKNVATPVLAAKVLVRAPVISAPPVPAPAPVAAKSTRKAGWADKLNPFRAPQPASEPMVNAVQPEFSLDAVKVLHNDLSDADVEVVPVKSRPATSAVKAAAGPMDYMNEPVLRTI